MVQNCQRNSEIIQKNLQSKMIIGLDGNEANAEKRVGSGKYAFELLKQFSKVQEHDFLIYFKKKPLPDLPKESRNFKYAVFGPKKMWTQFALPIKLTFSSKLDVFFSLGHYGPRFSKIPFVITVHDLSYLHFPDLFKKEDLYQLTNWTKYSIEKSSHVIAVSETTKDDIIKNYGVNPSKISAVYEGFDENRFKLQLKEKIAKIKKRYKIRGDYLIFIGTLQPRKNIERLIEAFHKLVRNSKFEIRNYKLIIVGRRGWLYDSILEKVKKINIEDKVTFTGYVSDSDLPALVSGADVYVLPSLWEGFGIPVIEAQACGTPAVVSNTSSLPEVVGNSAFLVDPENVNSIANGIKKVLTNEELRRDLIKRGYANVKRFSWQKCAEATLDTLERVASS